MGFYLACVHVCMHFCTPVLVISSSAAIEPRQDSDAFIYLFFLLPVVEVFTVLIHVCVMWSGHLTVFNGNLPLCRIFSSKCVGGCCADVEHRETRREKDGGRVRNKEHISTSSKPHQPPLGFLLVLQLRLKNINVAAPLTKILLDQISGFS